LRRERGREREREKVAGIAQEYPSIFVPELRRNHVISDNDDDDDDERIRAA